MFYGWVIFGVAVALTIETIKVIETKKAKTVKKEPVYTEEDLTQELMEKNRKMLEQWKKVA